MPGNALAMHEDVHEVEEIGSLPDDLVLSLSLNELLGLFLNFLAHALGG